jgi:hypothetical protein
MAGLIDRSEGRKPKTISDVRLVKGEEGELSERVRTIVNHLKFQSTDLEVPVEFS